MTKHNTTINVFHPQAGDVTVFDGALLTVRIAHAPNNDGWLVALHGDPEQLLELTRAIRNQILDAIAARHTNTVDTPTVEDHFTGDAVTERLLHDATKHDHHDALAARAADIEAAADA